MSKETAPEAVTFTVPPVPCTFSLKDSCDATLQSAFYGNNYPTVVVLAKQRFKATKDPYYQVSGIYHLFDMHTPRIHISIFARLWSLGSLWDGSLV